jgi:hypothetical protein
MTPALMLPWWMPSPEAQLERERILASRYFLVKIAGNGDVWRCKRCHAKHRYLTLGCVEQPFSGLTGGLWAYYRTVGLHGAEAFMSPGERARYARMRELLGAVGRAPDLATSHPQMARAIATPEGDADIGAVALGLLEPIDRRKAQQLANAINARGVKPPFRLVGLNA